MQFYCVLGLDPSLSQYLSARRSMTDQHPIFKGQIAIPRINHKCSQNVLRYPQERETYPVDSVIHPLNNRGQEDSAVRFLYTFQLGSDLSLGQQIVRGWRFIRGIALSTLFKTGPCMLRCIHWIASFTLRIPVPGGLVTLYVTQLHDNGD